MYLSPQSPNRSNTRLKDKKIKGVKTKTIQMAWLASKEAKYYIQSSGKTICCSAACETSFSFNYWRIHSHRKHPARLGIISTPSTTHPVIISQTGVLALFRPLPHAFFNPYRFPLLVFLPTDVTQTWQDKKAGWRRQEIAGRLREKQTSRVDGGGDGGVGRRSSSEVAAAVD